MRRKIPIILTVEEIQKIIKIPNEKTRTGLRNKAMLSFIWDSGCRVNDLINLRPGNINIGKREVTVLGGKGGVDRNLLFSDYTASLLKKYKDQRPESKYFFCTEYQTNNTKNRKQKTANKLDRVYIYNTIRNYAKRAGINKRVGPHTFRHSYALNFYRATHDLITLQKILGHKSLVTTQIYCYIDNTDVKKASEVYYKKRDDHYEDPGIASKIEDLEKQLRLLKASI